MSQVSCCLPQLHSSSHQAASCCGPRRRSGSSAEYSMACAPLGHTQAALGGLIQRPVPRRRRWRRCRFAQHHDVAGVGGGGATSAMRMTPSTLHQLAHPFGAGAGLAGAAPGQEQPVAPVAGRRQLREARPGRPVESEQRLLAGIETGQEACALLQAPARRASL